MKSEIDILKMRVINPRDGEDSLRTLINEVRGEERSSIQKLFDIDEQTNPEKKTLAFPVMHLEQGFTSPTACLLPPALLDRRME